MFFGLHDKDIQKVMDECVSAIKPIISLLTKCEEIESVENLDKFLDHFESEVIKGFESFQMDLARQEKYIPFQKTQDYLLATMIYETLDTLNRIQLFSDANLDRFVYSSLKPAETGREDFTNTIVMNGEYIGVMHYINSEYDISDYDNAFGIKIEDDIKDYYIDFLSEEYAAFDEKNTADDYREAFDEKVDWNDTYEDGKLTFSNLAKAYKHFEDRDKLGEELKGYITKEKDSHENTY